MIRLTRLKGGVMHLNADLVGFVESHHDTVITLLDGRTFVVLESAEQVVDAITTYRATVLARAAHLPAEVVRDEDEPGARLLVLRPEGTPTSEGGQ